MKQIFVKLMLRLTTYVTMLPTSSARKTLAATSKPSRSSPSAPASAQDSSSDKSPPFWVSSTFSREARSAGFRRGAMSDHSRDGKASSPEDVISRGTNSSNFKRACHFPALRQKHSRVHRGSIEMPDQTLLQPLTRGPELLPQALLLLIVER